jgi:hypothetical protein
MFCLLQFLTYFHKQKRQRGVDDMLLRLYEPFIWRSVKVYIQGHHEVHLAGPTWSSMSLRQSTHFHPRLTWRNKSLHESTPFYPRVNWRSTSLHQSTLYTLLPQAEMAWEGYSVLLVLLVGQPRDFGMSISNNGWLPTRCIVVCEHIWAYDGTSGLSEPQFRQKNYKSCCPSF